MTLEELEVKEKEALNKHIELQHKLFSDDNAVKNHQLIEECLISYDVPVKKFNLIERAFIVYVYVNNTPILLDIGNELQITIDNFEAGKHKEISKEVKKAADFVLKTYMKDLKAKSEWHDLDDKLTIERSQNG